MKWFKHQADANLNAKLQEVILDHGMEGYGLYWFCIELVAMNVTSSKLTFELEHDARIIARMTGLPASKVESIMTDFISLDLFSASEGRIQCLKLAKRCDDFTAKAIRTNGVQAIESNEEKQSPTKSENVPLEDRSKKVEGRSKNVEDIPKNDSNIEEQFNIFWDRYHKKQNKAQAMKSFKAAIKRCKIKNVDEFTEMLITDCDNRIRVNQFGFDNLNASTYLNNNRWEDETKAKFIESEVKPEWMRGLS